MSESASVNDVRRAIDEALTTTGYSCKVVSWDDVSRGTVNGALSCWGSNITDTRLSAKDGTRLFTVRSDNWNEKLGVIDASHLALLVGNCEASGTLRNITLADFLRSPYTNGAAYSGLEAGTSLAAMADTKVSIRFQTVFLPVTLDSATGRGSLQFATEAYNYATRSDNDPRNIVLLATTQGLSVQADGAGNKRLFQHKRMEDGKVGEYWLEAESTRHKVGGEQNETLEERTDALARGKATSEVIGIKAMGKRFNVLMTIQVPLKQQERNLKNALLYPSYPMYSAATQQWMQAAAMRATCRPLQLQLCMKRGYDATSIQTRRCRRRYSGVSSAARVSRGDYHGPYGGLTVKTPTRNDAEHVTVTCVLYNTVADGVPTPVDCMAAVEDMNKLYAACSDEGRLADAAFDFMKKELTVGDVAQIQHKLTTQPPRPPSSTSESTNRVLLLRSKLNEMSSANIDKKSVHKLKLLTFGAVTDNDTKSVLTEYFDKLIGALETPEQARELFFEMKMAIDGMLFLENQ